MDKLQNDKNNDISDDCVKKEENEDKTAQSKFYDTLVCSGGGTKGFSLLGALEYLHDNDLLENIKTFVGSSVGGIISALIVVGYIPSELFEVISKIHLFKMKNQNFHNIITDYGIDNGKKLEILLKKLLLFKQIDENITLGELFNKTKLKLILTSTCINNREPVYLSYETHPNLQLITALRMSTAIPFYFTPILYDDKYFIDGSCMDDFPIHLFNEPELLKHTIGIYLTTKYDESKIENIEDFLSSTIQSVNKSMSLIIKKFYKNNIIDIVVDYSNIGFLDFNISDDVKNEIYKNGYVTTKQFFENKN